MSQRLLPHLVIRASAGSGKTFQLSNRFLELVFAREPLDQVLATTFTRKAAGEILGRVAVRLVEAARNERRRRDLAGHLKLEKLTRGDCLDALSELTRNLHRLRISTLDSFFAQTARSYSLEVGLPLGWRIGDELEDQRLRDQAVEAVLSDDDRTALFTLLNLLTKGESTRSISQLIRNTVSDLYDVYLETEDDAWRRVQRPKPPSPQELAKAITMLEALPDPRHKSIAKQYANDLAAARGGRWEVLCGSGLVKKILEGETEYYSRPIPQVVAAIYRTLIAQIKAELVGRAIMQTESTRELLARFDQHYGRLKAAQRAVRFDDVTRSLAAFSQKVEAARLSFRLDGRINHLLLDEFQDTSLIQWRVLESFAREVAGRQSPPGDERRSFFCVGDVKQAIYGWRGGVAEIFDALDDQLTGLVEQSLDRSYRSAPPIMEAVNRIFQNIGRHPNLGDAAGGVHQWRQRFHTHSTARTDLSGHVILETARQREEGESALDVTAPRAAEIVSRWVEQAPHRTVGVLCRTNDAVRRMIDELRSRDVRASEEGGNPLTDSAAVLLVLSLLRMADHPGDSTACFHVANSPLSQAWELDARDPHNRERAATAAARIREQLLTRGYGAFIHEQATHLAPACDEREMSRLRQLVDLAYAYQPWATLRTSDFIQHLKHTPVADPTASNVRVMTVHQAKGLEFDLVMLADLDQNLIGQRDNFVTRRPAPTEPADLVFRYVNQTVQAMLPQSVQSLFQQAIDRKVGESLCVFYVALTRAAHALHMVIPPAAESEKKVRANYAGLLRVALADGDGPPEKKLFECGDPNWLGAEAAAGNTPEAKPTDTVGRQTAARGPIRLAASPHGRRRGRERAAPSSLEGGSRVRLRALTSQTDNAQALVRGTVIHALFEAIEWRNEGLPARERLQTVARQALERAALEHPRAAGELDLDQLLREFQQTLAAPAISQILRREAYLGGGSGGGGSGGSGGSGAPIFADLAGRGNVELHVYNERQFAVALGGRLCSGAIDRLVVAVSGGAAVAADVVDFKTDAIVAPAVGQRVEHYRPQVEAYRQAVERLLGIPLKMVSARLVFVAVDHVAAVSS